jgi:hypothetical protein
VPETQAPRPKNLSLIFIHVPRTGGTTLNTVIERQYPRHSTFTIDGKRVSESIIQFKSLPLEDRAQIKCLKGHMLFGLHEYLPQPTAYISMLRDPVDRIISHYYFVLRTSDHYLHETVVSKKMDLTDYVSSGISMELKNGQACAMSGRYAKSTDVLETAKRNLRQHFLLVGLAERFDESLMLFSKLLGWKKVWYIKRNVVQERPAKNELPIQVLNTIRKHNELDIELYEFCKQIFEEKLREHALDSRKLQLFRISNWGYAALYSLMKSIFPRKVKGLRGG